MAGHWRKATPVGVGTTCSQVRAEEGPAEGAHDVPSGGADTALPVEELPMVWTLASWL